MAMRSICSGPLLAALAGPLIAADIRMEPNGDDRNDGRANEPVDVIEALQTDPQRFLCLSQGVAALVLLGSCADQTIGHEIDWLRS